MGLWEYLKDISPTIRYLQIALNNFLTIDLKYHIEISTECEFDEFLSHLRAITSVVVDCLS